MASTVLSKSLPLQATHKVTKSPGPKKPLEAPGFTIKSTVKNVNVIPPPAAGSLSERNSKQTAFKKFYDRGDFPIALEHDTKGNKIAWKVEIDKLDYHHYLPLFFEGLCETEHPYLWRDGRTGTRGLLQTDLTCPEYLQEYEPKLRRRNRLLAAETGEHWRLDPRDPGGV